MAGPWPCDGHKSYDLVHNGDGRKTGLTSALMLAASLAMRADVNGLLEEAALARYDVSWAAAVTTCAHSLPDC